MATKLYFSPGACSFASHIALEEIGKPYETQKVSLADGENRKPEYLKLNPRGKVPTLVVDGNVLTENVGILSYLAGGNPKAGLWPKETWDQAKIIASMAWLSNTVHPAYGRYFRPERFTTDAAGTEAVKASARAAYEGALKEIDTLLEGRKWAVGDHYTVLDGYLLVFYRWGNRSKIDVKSLRNYTALMDKVLARPAVKKVMAGEGITLE